MSKTSIRGLSFIKCHYIQDLRIRFAFKKYIVSKIRLVLQRKTQVLAHYAPSLGLTFEADSQDCMAPLFGYSNFDAQLAEVERVRKAFFGWAKRLKRHRAAAQGKFIRLYLRLHVQQVKPVQNFRNFPPHTKVCNILLQFTPPSQRISTRPPPPLHHPCCPSTAVAPVAPPVTSLSSSAMPAAGCARPGNTSVWAAGGYSVALMSGAFVNPARAIYRNRQRLRHGH